MKELQSLIGIHYLQAFFAQASCGRGHGCLGRIGSCGGQGNCGPLSAGKVISGQFKASIGKVVGGKSKSGAGDRHQRRLKQYFLHETSTLAHPVLWRSAALVRAIGPPTWRRSSELEPVLREPVLPEPERAE